MGMPGKHAPAYERFWRHVHKVEIGCWEWTASLNTSGYGQFNATSGQPPIRAHRYSWVLHFGSIPDGFFVCHHCDNPRCVRPDHLFLGTAEHNNRDARRKGRIVPAGPGNWRGTRSEEHIARFVATVRRLTDADIAQARRRYADGESCRSIARRLGCAHTTISRLIAGEHWQHHVCAEEPSRVTF
jgi:hypothetical protein